MKGYGTQLRKAYNISHIKEEERAMGNKRIDDSRALLKQYIKYYELFGMPSFQELVDHARKKRLRLYYCIKIIRFKI